MRSARERPERAQPDSQTSEEKVMPRSPLFVPGKNAHLAAEAYIKFATAVRTGDVKRSDFCQSCGSDKSIEAHHEDYAFPTVVIWLCQSCHRLLHHRPTDGTKVNVSFRCDKQLRKLIKAAAAEANVTLGEVMESAIKYWLENVKRYAA